jgi:Domain of unknown function (DUF6456)/Helix-turn-helix domain
MTAMSDMRTAYPDWLPETARLYLLHTAEGLSIRELARKAGCHASTILRQVRRLEMRRDDPLVDEGLDWIGMQAGLERPCDADAGVEFDVSGDQGMTAQLRVDYAVPHRDEATLLNEARRVLRRLSEAGALLAVAPDMEKAIVLKGALRTGVVDRNVAQAFALKDWISVHKAGKVTTYEITSAGRAALKRMLNDDQEQANPGFSDAPSAFAEQHRVWDTRLTSDRNGGLRRVRYNLSESPLTALSRRRDKDGEMFLTIQQVAAGERLREDFELAHIGPRVAQNWDRFLTAGDRGGYPTETGAGGSSSARDRVALALRELGPGLGDMVLRTCCFLEGLEVAEKRMGWSARSGKIVLRIALTRLIRHYEDTYGKGSPLIG